MELLGLHHVSAITADAAGCADFYGRLLGLAGTFDSGAGTLAFRTDPERPGEVLSFQIAPGASPGTAGRGLVHRLQWLVSGPEALRFWRRRLELAGVGVTAWLNGAGDPLSLRFADPEGLEHEMVLLPIRRSSFAGHMPLKRRTPAGEGAPAAASGAIPPALRLRRLDGVRAYAAASVQSGDLLAGRLGFQARGEGEWLVGGPAEATRYGCDPPPPSRPLEGAGTVRHVAWSCRPGEERAWRQRVIGMGATVSRVLDCDGYRCFFFREPDGVLFAVASRRAAAAATGRRFDLPHPNRIPPRIARPIGLPTAA